MSCVILPSILSILSHHSNIPQGLGGAGWGRFPRKAKPQYFHPLLHQLSLFVPAVSCFSCNLLHRDTGAPHSAHRCPPAVQLCG